MQTQATWADFGIHALTILVPGLLVLVSTWVTLRHQRKLKETEMKSQSEFKARELIFDIRRKKLDRYTETMNKLAGDLGGLMMKIRLASEEEKKTVGLPILQFLKGTLLEFALQPPPAVAEGLQHLYQLCTPEEVVLIRETLNLNMDDVDPTDYDEVMMRYARIINSLQGAEGMVLQEICIDTFSDFLPESLKAGCPPKLPLSKIPDSPAISSEN